MSTPATEKQIKYARDLGLKFPKDITTEEMSQLLDKHLSKDEPSPYWLMEYMNNFNLGVTKYLGRRNAYNWIWNHFKETNNDLELGIWFTYQICRHEMKKSWDDPNNSGINRDKIQNIAQQLIDNPKMLASIKRYNGDDLNEFGEYKNPDSSYSIGGSKRTAAYNVAKDLIKHEIGIINQDKRTSKSRKSMRKTTSSNTGCLVFFIGGFIIIGSIGFSVLIF